MVTISSNGHSRSLDALAREYILALKQGHKPEDRPADFGPWDMDIQTIENVCTKSQGDIEKISLIIDALSSANPALHAMLNPPPKLEDVVKNDTSDPGFPVLPEQVKLDPSLSVGACQFLDTYEKFSRKASPEGYGDYHAFCGLWALSVGAARRVYLPLGRKRIYTNLMIALCGRTSLFAKTSTAMVAKEVLVYSGLGYLIGPDRTSPAKLLSDMAGTHIPTNYEELSPERQERIKKKLAMSGQKGLFNDEFGKFVQGMLRKGSTTSDFAELFLTLDGCPQEYENSTIARGGEPIQKPYLPLLGGMTPANLKDNAKSGADFWTDGFWARFSFLAAPPDSYIDDPLDVEDLAIPHELTEALRDWHQRLGVPQCYVEPILDKKQNETGRYSIEREDLPERACTIAPEAHSAWKRYRSALKRMLVDFKHEDFHGSYTRLPETAMRIAILMASLENDNRIELKHWAKAQELAEILRKNLHELYRQVNLSPESETAKIEDEILNKLKHIKAKGIPAITVSQMKNWYMKTQSYDRLRELMDGMVKVGVLKREVTPHAKQGRYSLAGEEDEDG